MHYLYICLCFMSLHVHCTAFYSPATEALINNNNNLFNKMHDIGRTLAVGLHYLLMPHVTGQPVSHIG